VVAGNVAQIIVDASKAIAMFMVPFAWCIIFASCSLGDLPSE
jgi:hypothetical protein